MEHQQAVRNLAVECYLLDEMTPGERDAFEEHYFECTLCADDLRAASLFLDDAREILRENPAAAPRGVAGRPVSDSFRGWLDPGWLAWLKPAFAAPALAALLVLAGIQSLRIIPSLHRQVEQADAPRGIASAVLRPATRGEPVILAVRSGSAVLLTLDLPRPPAAATPLQFVIESADGRPVLTAPGNAPEPGLPVNLMIPRLELPAGTYTLVVEHAAAPDVRGPELGRFPFQLKP